MEEDGEMWIRAYYSDTDGVECDTLSNSHNLYISKKIKSIIFTC